MMSTGLSPHTGHLLGLRTTSIILGCCGIICKVGLFYFYFFEPLPVVGFLRPLEGLAEGDLLAVRGDFLLAACLAVRLEEVLDCYAVLCFHRALSVLLLHPLVLPGIERAERAYLLALREGVGDLP